MVMMMRNQGELDLEKPRMVHKKTRKVGMQKKECIKERGAG
jgi:hypothetical protein